MFDVGDGYLFDAFKIDDKYYAIAVNKNLNLNIDKKNIKSLKIAQKELYQFDCLDVGGHSIKKIEDILFCFPKDENCQNKIDKILSDIKLSNYTVSLDTINLDKSSLILIFSSFVFLISYFFIGALSYKKDLTLIENQKASLSKYNLPLTSFQLNAIYANLKTVDKAQKAIRKDLEIFSNTPLKKNEEYLRLVFNQNYDIKIKTSSNLDGYFSKHFTVLQSNFKNKIYSAKLNDE